MLNEGGFDGAFFGLFAKPQEIEAVGILEGLAGEIGLRLGKAKVEVGDGFAFALQPLRFDMEVENITRPAVLDGLPGVGEPPLGGFEPGEENDVVAPEQSSNSLLDDCGIGPGFGEGTHVEQVGAGEALHFRKGDAKVAGKALDDFGSPALLGLAGEDVFPKLPVEGDELAVDRERGALLCLMSAGLEVHQPCRVVGWHKVIGHSRVLSDWL